MYRSLTAGDRDGVKPHQLLIRLHPGPWATLGTGYADKASLLDALKKRQAQIKRLGLSLEVKAG
jgi:hypothetical protein